MRSRTRLSFSMISTVLVVLAVTACGSDSSDDERSDAGAPIDCAGQGCSSDEFCNYEYDWCKPVSGLYSSGAATCASRELDCPPGIPVCGCDGNVYPDACAAYAEGVDLGASGPTQNEFCDGSKTPFGRFLCGGWYCDPAVSYCSYREGDVGDRVAECLPLPAACNGTATCDCVPPPEMSPGCTIVQGHGVTGVLVHIVWI